MHRWTRTAQILSLKSNFVRKFNSVAIETDKMTTTIAYACLASIIFMFSLLCLFVVSDILGRVPDEEHTWIHSLLQYTYGVKFTKDVRRSRSSSVFTISPYFGSNPTCPPLPVYNIRTGKIRLSMILTYLPYADVNNIAMFSVTDLPPSYEQVVIGINVTPASISAAPERVPVQWREFVVFAFLISIEFIACSLRVKSYLN